MFLFPFFWFLYCANGFPNVVGNRKHGAPVEEDLDHLVVVRVCRQDQRGDVGCERGSVTGDRLPTLQHDQLVDKLLLNGYYAEKSFQRD